MGGNIAGRLGPSVRLFCQSLSSHAKCRPLRVAALAAKGERVHRELRATFELLRGKNNQDACLTACLAGYLVEMLAKQASMLQADKEEDEGEDEAN